MAGRPRKQIDGQLVEKLASYGMAEDEIADCLGISKSLLRYRCREELRRGRLRLRRTVWKLQLRAAKSGNVGMLIWLGRSVLGQKIRKGTSWDDLMAETQLEAEDWAGETEAAASSSGVQKCENKADSESGS